MSDYTMADYRIDEPLSADDFDDPPLDEDALYDALAAEADNVCVGDCSDCTRADENGECDG